MSDKKSDAGSKEAALKREQNQVRQQGGYMAVSANKKRDDKKRESSKRG
jgi:hypothetical protein